MLCMLIFYNMIVCNMQNTYKTYHLKVTGKCFEINITPLNEQVKHITSYIMTGIMLY